MEITPRELALLNIYRASELHGGLVLGQMARRCRSPELVLDLTRHAAEEVMHAQLWTETIIAVGGKPWPQKDTYQTRYAADVGTPTTMLEVLALTQVFERRVYGHFVEHLRRPGTHPRVRATLARMIEEERGHLSWVRRWLDERAGAAPARVAALLRRYEQADARVYDALAVELGWRAAA